MKFNIIIKQMNNLLNKIINFIIISRYYFKIHSVTLKKNIPNHDLNKKLTVSITVKFERLRYVSLTLKSILNQTVNPDEVILWIEKKYKNKIPKKILKFKKYGLKIFFCNNIKSYNKIIHTLKIRKNNYIITFDDDIIYNKRSIEFLVKKSKKDKKSIIANRVHKIILNKQNYPIPYSKWKWNSTEKKRNKLNFLTGVYGVLYPPKCFYKDVINIKKIIKLSPYADDVWLNWMLRLNKRYVVWSGFKEKNFEISFYKKKNLRDINISKNYNDLQIRNMIEKYGFPY